jgi:uncharacterized membrane protein
VEVLETTPALDAVADQLAAAARPLAEGGRGDVLRGRWLGHALHPLLTDFPLGCWLSAGLLDLFGGRGSRPAARRLVGLGLVFSVPAAAAGLADWSAARTHDPRVRRVGVVHAAGNLAVAGLYWRSWRCRHRGQHLRGISWALLGGGLALGTGWLGGHMTLAYGAGRGERGLDGDAPAGARGLDLIGVEEAGRCLGVPVEQVRAMVDQGLLVPAGGGAGGPRFHPADVEAVRLQGG